MLKFSSVILVGVIVWRHHDPVAELAPCQRLLRFLTIRDTVELDKHLNKKHRSINKKKNKQISVTSRKQSNDLSIFKNVPSPFHIRGHLPPLEVSVSQCCVHSHIYCTPLWNNKKKLATTENWLQVFQNITRMQNLTFLSQKLLKGPTIVINEGQMKIKLIFLVIGYLGCKK